MYGNKSEANKPKQQWLLNWTSWLFGVFQYLPLGLTYSYTDVIQVRQLGRREEWCDDECKIHGLDAVHRLY